MNGDFHLGGNNVIASRQMLSALSSRVSGSPRNRSRRATMGPASEDLMGFRGHMQLMGLTQNNLEPAIKGLCQQAKKRGWEQVEDPVDVCVQKVRVVTKKRKPRRARTSRAKLKVLSHRGVNNAPDNTNEFLFSDRKENKEDLKEMTGADFMITEFTREYEQETRNKQRKGKEDLINEYMMMEKAVSSLEKRMEEVTTREEMKALYGDVGYEWRKGEMHMEPDTAEKIRIFQEEITRLIQENSGLGGDNVRLRQENQAESGVSSSGESEQTSGHSSDTSGHSSDEESEESMDSECTDNQSKKDDTGYESDRSWGSGKELGIKTVSSTCGS